MSRMLTSIEASFSRAQSLASLGKRSEARNLLRGLLRIPDSSPDFLIRLRREAGELAIAMERYREARYHWKRAIELSPEAAFFYFWGRAHELDPHGCDNRAARLYRKAVELNASEPKYRAALGRALIRTDKVTSGIKVLRQAAQAAPTDPEVLEIVRDGLREAKQARIAFEILSKARFLAPANRAIRTLWELSKFDMSVERQSKSTPKKLDKRPDQAILPFIRLHRESATESNALPKILPVRRDAGSVPVPHIDRLKAYRG